MRQRQNVWLGAASVVLVGSWLAATAIADQKADPTGTWKWERTFGDNTIQFILRLQRHGDKVTGTHETRRGKTKIEQGKLDGNKLSFQYTREFNGNQFTVKYEGKVSEDRIQGKGEFSSSRGSREFDWEAKRVVRPDDVLGTWQFKIETPNGNVLEPSITLTKKDDKLQGKYTSRFGQREAKEIKIQDNQLTFQIAGQSDSGGEFKVTYKGKPRGNSITGTIDYDFNGQTGTIEFEGKRVQKKEKQKQKQKEK